MAVAAATKKTVVVDGRIFIVHRDAQGYPLRVYERMLHEVGRPWECWKNVGRWVATSHTTPKRGLIFRVLGASK